MKSIFIILTFILSGTALFGQDTTYFKNEVSGDIANIFRAINPSFTYRYHWKNNAFRLRVNPTLDFSFGTNLKDTPGNSTSSHVSGSTNGASYAVTLRLGYENNIKWNKVWFYYGADLLLYTRYSWTSATTNTQNYDSVGVATTHSKVENNSVGKETQVGGAPFMGVRYFFTPRLAISTETGFTLALKIVQNSSDKITNVTVHSQDKATGITFYWNSPLINFSYFF